MKLDPASLGTQDQDQDQGFTAMIERAGAVVIPGVFSTRDIEEARRQVLQNLYLLKNTRATAS